MSYPAGKAFKPFFTTHEVAVMFGVADATVIRWNKRGLLKCRYTPGGHRRYPRTDVLALFQLSQTHQLDRLNDVLGQAEGD